VSTDTVGTCFGVFGLSCEQAANRQIKVEVQVNLDVMAAMR